MKKLKLYLETSVWNFYFAEDAPEKRQITWQFFNQLDDYDLFVSEVVFQEIEQAPAAKRQILLDLVDKYSPTELKITAVVPALAQRYRVEGALPEKSIADSLHAAIATVSEMDALISWNLKHLANLKRMTKINEINLTEGYSKKLELITPLEVSDDLL
jgi:predicted nucleic acid-binding protein